MNKLINYSKKTKMRCPRCSNYVEVLPFSKGGVYGNCNICNSTFYSKEHSAKEQLIRIIKH